MVLGCRVVRWSGNYPVNPLTCVVPQGLFRGVPPGPYWVTAGPLTCRRLRHHSLRPSPQRPAARVAGATTPFRCRRQVCWISSPARCITRPLSAAPAGLSSTGDPARSRPARRRRWSARLCGTWQDVIGIARIPCGGWTSLSAMPRSGDSEKGRCLPPKY